MFIDAPRAGESVLINCDNARNQWYELDEIERIAYDFGRGVWEVYDGNKLLAIAKDSNDVWVIVDLLPIRGPICYQRPNLGNRLPLRGVTVKTEVVWEVE